MGHLIFVLGMVAVLVPGVVGVMAGWHEAQYKYFPVVTDWEVTSADLSGLGQLVVEGKFQRRFRDDQCQIEWIRFYAKGQSGRRPQLSYQSIGDLRRVEPDRINKPKGVQTFGPIAIDTSPVPSANVLEGKTLHRCFEAGPFSGFRMVSKLPDYDYSWLKSNIELPP